MYLTTMSGKQNLIKTKVISNLKIWNLHLDKCLVIPTVYTNSNWPFAKDDTPTRADVAGLSYLEEIPLKYIENGNIGLLIGMNVPQLMRPSQVIPSTTDISPHGPYATLHVLGWALQGPVLKTPDGTELTTCCVTELTETNDLHDRIEKLFSRDFVENNDQAQDLSVEDKLWHQRVDQSLKRLSGGNYEIGLPFREDSPCLPTNRFQVLARFNSLKKRMLKNSSFATDYTKFMVEMIENDFVERVPDSEICGNFGKVWYLVHHGVYHKQKNKLRIVFDASLKTNAVSLNTELLQGPDLTNSLLAVLLRFRREKVAVMADVAKMFYQIKVPKHHRDYLRFFWYPQNNPNLTPIEYRLKVHVFGAISSPAVANFALKQAPKYTDCSPEATSCISDQFYVDDLLHSVEEEGQAVRLIEEVKSTLANSGFKLTAFASNSREVLRNFPIEERSKPLKTIDILTDALPTDHALGVTWDTETDTLGFKIRLPQGRLTKRSILSTIFTIYDPLGLVTPALIPAKRVFQDACRQHLPWDETIKGPLAVQWNSWLNSIALLDNFKIPRCYKPPQGTTSPPQIHVFADGSEVAYGSIAYVRFVSPDGTVSCTPVMAKARLTPLNNKTLKTVPRIELNAAVLATAIFQVLNRELNYGPITYTFWTDSTVVLNYIGNETARYQRFVAVRIAKIHGASNSSQWRHVSSKQNPADLISRGTSAQTLVDSELWKSGPRFLRQTEDHWPPQWSKKQLDADDPEVKVEVKASATKLTILSTSDKLLESTSSWHKLKCRMAAIIRVQRRFSKRFERVRPNKVKYFTPSELHDAENAIVKYEQARYFPEVIKILTNKRQPNKNELPKGHQLVGLCPFIENGLVRVGGRLRYSDLSYAAKHPIILPKQSAIAKLILSHTHQIVGHMGREAMLASVREKYWIVQASKICKQIVNLCILCRKRTGRVGEQIMADLPEERVTGDRPPFYNTGVDYFGPFATKHGRKTEKKYGVIFSCLATRAVHLEIANSLNTSSFIAALRRFICRRGAVHMIRSDNGTNFVGANRELRSSIREWNQVHLNSFLSQNQIEWKFSAPLSSHQNGVWEREIRSIRSIFNALLNGQHIRLTDEELATLMCEVEAILNGRPLTPMSDNADDLEVITPNHLLLHRAGSMYPPGIFVPSDGYNRRRWRQCQHLIEQFWSRWRKSYLPLLQTRQKWFLNRDPLQIGDLVLVVDQILPRNMWRMARVIKVNPGQKTRIVTVAYNKNFQDPKLKQNHVTLTRPVNKLILLRKNRDL